MGFVEAVEAEFECPGCGEKLREADNGDIVSSLEERAEKLERALEDSSKGEG